MLTMRQEFVRQRVQVTRFNQFVVPVHSDEITLHKDAASILEGAGRQLAQEAHVPYKLVVERLFDFVYRLEPSGVLIFVLYVPEREMEVTIELPDKYWKFAAQDSGYEHAYAG